jgi:hypothetical protein
MQPEHQDQPRLTRHIFLLALWQEQADGPWRASLRPAGGTDRQGFATIEELAAYLLQLAAPGVPAPNALDPDAAPGGS